MKEMLEWSNYLHANAHPGCEVSCQNWPVSSLRPCFVEASMMVENHYHCQPSTSYVACSTWILCRKLRMPWIRLWLGVCKTLMPDVVVPEVHQNDHSYVRELSGPTFDSLCSSLTWLSVIYTEDLKKNKQKNSKPEGGRLPRTIRYIKSEYVVYDHMNSIKSWKEVSSSVLKQIICYRIARNKGYTWWEMIWWLC